MTNTYNKTDKNGIIIQLKVVPNASRNEICGTIEDATGQQLLKVKVAAVPDDGKANKALIKFLAKEWNIASSNIEIISGTTSRNKKLLIKDKQCVLPIFPVNTA
jgi:uncharacterized protein